MFFVYILKSVLRNHLYVGLTSDIERRFHEHQSGKNKTTRPYRPFELIYSEEFPSREEARKGEKYWMSGCGKELLKSIVNKRS